MARRGQSHVPDPGYDSQSVGLPSPHPPLTPPLALATNPDITVQCSATPQSEATLATMASRGQSQGPNAGPDSDPYSRSATPPPPPPHTPYFQKFILPWDVVVSGHSNDDIGGDAGRHAHEKCKRRLSKNRHGYRDLGGTTVLISSQGFAGSHAASLASLRGKGGTRKLSLAPRSRGPGYDAASNLTAPYK